MRRAAKRDLSEPAIVQALEAAGCFVFRLNLPVDLLVHYRERWHLIECKSPGSHKDRRRKGQLVFVQQFNVPVVKTPDEALHAVGAIRR